MVRGFLGEFLFHNQKKEQQHIFCYYFNKLIENNGNINIQHLFRFRLFLEEFIFTQKNYQIKFVFHFKQKNDNQKKFEDHIVKCVYQILEGSFDKLNDIIGVYNFKENKRINYCSISSQQIHFNKNEFCNRCDNSFIIKLDEFLDYFQFNQNDPNQIGYLCQEYVQEQVNVVLKEFENELIHIQKDIQLMLEFPVNLNNEINVKQNVEEYLLNMKDTLSEFNQILKEVEFVQISKKIKIILKNKRQKFIDQLSEIAKQNTYFEIYLKQIYKDKSPKEVIDQLLQFQFELPESDIDFMQKLKNYNFNQDCLNKTLFSMRLNIKLWFEQYGWFLPQSYAQMKRIIFNYKDLNQDLPWVFVLGMTRVGKSTLLNILSKPDNIIINKDNRFDVKEKDCRFGISHECNSNTFQIQSLETNNVVFFDTPGLNDTNEINRFINHFNIYHLLTKQSEKIFLLMIDGEQLLIKKNDLIDTISQIQLMFGEQNDDQCFENLIFPLFTKIKKDSTMEQIKQKWQSEIMKDITDKFQLKILDLIKKAIDKDNYQKIYNADFFQMEGEQKQLELEIQTLSDKFQDLFDQSKMDEGRQLSVEIKNKKQELNNLLQGSFQKRMEKIQTDLIRKCENIAKGRQNKNPFFNFKFKLSAELKKHLQKLLSHRTNYYQNILNIITNDFIAKMLYDDKITIDDKFIQIYQMSKHIKEISKVSDIPEEFRSENINHQIKELNIFNDIISQYDNQKSDTQTIDFEELKQQLKHLYKAFTEVVPKYLEWSQSIKHGWMDSLQLNSKMFKVFPMAFYTAISIPVILLSGANDLFSNNLFVSEEEKRKEEKNNLIKIQQEYYKQLQNII